MSGDLKDPSSAIPKGTLRAIAITYVTYIALVWIVGLTCDRCSIEGGNSTTAVCPNETVTEAYWKRIDPATGIRFEDDAPTGGLLYNKLIMGAISAWKPLVYVGVWAATLSSALASLVGAPRILQSVASDKLFPWAWFNYFGEGKGATNEPVRAYFLTFFINCGCVAVAKLDIIAPLISNFFMVSYALTNYACFASSVSRAPGWRPSFKYYNKYLSLFGAALCILVMFLMDWANSLVTFFIVGAVYKYLDVLDPDVNWGPAGEARRYLTALRSLERLEAVTKTHVKTYRPQYLLMLGKPKERRWLAKFAACLQKGKGVIVCLDVVLPKDEVKDENISASRQNSLYTTAASSRRNSLASISGSSNNNYDDDFVPLDVHGMADDIRLVRQRRAAGSAFLSDKTIWKRGRLPGAFFDAVAAPSVVQGFKHGLQVAGLGKLRPNTLIVGMKKSEGDNMDAVAEYEEMLRTALASDMGLLVVSEKNGTLGNLDTSSGKGNAIQRLSSLGASRRNVTAAASSPAVIDVWWISEVGGLTMLIPHLMKKTATFRGAQLRVMTICNYSNHEETSRLARTEFRMVHLLRKFRIDAAVTGVDADLKSAPTDDSTALFEKIYGAPIDSLDSKMRKKTRKVVRMAEVMNGISPNSSMVYMTLPLPDKSAPPGLHTAWLSFFCEVLPCATIFIRGNNRNVLTFYL